ncbi:MAG: zf-HC2 domain-containing protein [Promicromonosporaceae bacterium]|nr:zf-HC2 domain-containing protein [Promicromonosporaceae bacterium]
MTDKYADWDAAYVLGALDPAERREYAAHLETCEECRTAVAGLAAIPPLLAAVPAPSPAADLPRSADVVPFARLAAAARRSRRRRRTGLVATAAGVAIVAGIGGGLLGTTSDGGGATPPTPSISAPPSNARTVELTPPGGATGMHATLTATPTVWGTRLEWSCRYEGVTTGLYGPGTTATGPVTYQLVLVDRAGGRSVAATWTTSSPTAEGLGASSALPVTDLARIEITVTGQQAPLAAVTL